VTNCGSTEEQKDAFGLTAVRFCGKLIVFWNWLWHFPCSRGTNGVLKNSKGATPMKSFLSYASIALTLFVIGCSSDKKDAGPSPKELYKNDISALTNMSSVGPQKVDVGQNRAFTKIFGGSTSRDVKNYLDERIKYIFNETDMAGMSVSPANLGESIPWANEEGLSNASTNKEDVQTIAQNDGSGLWFTGRMEDVEVTLHNGSQIIPIESMRTGVVSLGKEYKATENVEGQAITIPVDYRLSFVMHEARHSDCTEGFSEDFRLKAKTAKSYSEFLKSINKQQITCGHLHVACPPFHEYAGVLACDYETWGAYGVGAIYALASERGLKEGSLEQRIMEVAYQDQLSRLLGNKSISDFNYSSPDMSSKDD
jgi:hypothetical protein